MSEVRQTALKALLRLSNKPTWLTLVNNCGHNYLKKKKATLIFSCGMGTPLFSAGTFLPADAACLHWIYMHILRHAIILYGQNSFSSWV